MTIIKNLIRKNKLRKQLLDIENILHENGYYDKEKELRLLSYSPDAYAELHTQINNEFGELFDRQRLLNQQINNLSGIKLFKKQDYEYTK